MAQWLEHRTGDQGVLGSNPGRATSELCGNSVYPALPVSFGGDTKSRWSLLSGVPVYARGSKITHYPSHR